MTPTSVPAAIRALTEADAEAFAQLRRAVTAVDPVGIGLSMDEELSRTIEGFRAQLGAPALALYRSFGFVPCGSEPEAVQLDGRFFDGVHMTLARSGTKT